MKASVIVVILVVVFLVLWCSSKKDKFKYTPSTSEMCKNAYATAYAFCVDHCDGEDCDRKCVTKTADWWFSLPAGNRGSYVPFTVRKCVNSE
jgi:hypothetical protein